MKKAVNRRTQYWSILFLALCGVTSGCDKEDLKPPELVFRQLPDNRIRYDALEAGQESRYLIASGHLNDENRPDVAWTGDTLVVSVTGITEDGFVVREALSDGSPNADLYDASCMPLRSLYRILADTLVIQPLDEECPNSLLIGRLPAKIYLGKMKENGVAIDDFFQPGKGWPTSGFVQDYTHHGYRFEHLNISGMDGRPWDGPYHAILYTASSGVVRRYGYTGWTGTLAVVDLMPD